MRFLVAGSSFIALLAFGGWQVLPEDAPTAAAAVSADTVTVGSRFVSILRISPGVAARVSAGAPEATPLLALTDSVVIEAGAADGAWRIRYPLVAWRTGELPQVRAPLTIISDDGTSQSYEIALALPFVASVLPEDTTGLEPRGPKGILEAPRERFPWWIPIVALTLLLSGAAIVWRRRSRLGPEMTLVAASARDRALAELSSPGLRTLIEEGRFGEGCAHISEILRHFLLEIDPRWTLDLTTTELIEAMVSADLPADQLRRLEDQLVRLDQVKFAGAVPSPTEAAELMEEVRETVVRWM